MNWTIYYVSYPKTHHFIAYTTKISLYTVCKRICWTLNNHFDFLECMMKYHRNANSLQSTSSWCIMYSRHLPSRNFQRGRIRGIFGWKCAVYSFLWKTLGNSFILRHSKVETLKNWRHKCVDRIINSQELIVRVAEILNRVHLAQ